MYKARLVAMGRIVKISVQTLRVTKMYLGRNFVSVIYYITISSSSPHNNRYLYRRHHNHHYHHHQFFSHFTMLNITFGDSSEDTTGSPKDQ